MFLSNQSNCNNMLEIDSRSSIEKDLHSCHTLRARECFFAEEASGQDVTAHSVDFPPPYIIKSRSECN